MVAANDNHPDSGIVGAMALFPAPTPNGHVGLAYTFATQRIYQAGSGDHSFTS
jgi:hypothetical protein